MVAQNEINHPPEMTFEQFFDQYYKRLAAYCRAVSPGEDPDDLVEEAFIALWKHWGQLESHAEFVLFTWTKKAIAFGAKAAYRKRAKGPALVSLEEQIDEGRPIVMEDAAPSVEDSVVEDETYRQYLAEINKRLSPTDQRLFECVILSELSIKETAQALSKSEKAVSVAVTRLRARLRDKVLPEVLPRYTLR